ncbi:SET and MYND domain-containing protein 4-like [Penaeus chinensis]|uniref:SET and MYND domain-containing protein 4-like n=1 Tax=Penaeus chinensis TaxID=139456 RepID=UPI001FB7710C|nr:SET and MYND domain-containing protein 4-like [Penaeus chinensis]
MEKTLNLKAMITKFLKEIKHKLGETMTHFDPEDDEEYMFAYLWGMHEAHRFLTPQVPAAAKSQESAEVCRSEGNRYYNMGNFETARSLYSKGIMLAPHPSLNENSSSRGRTTPGGLSLQDTESIDNRSTYEDYDTLAICYANRSAVHLELGYFDDCLRDIDLAFQAGYPDETKLMKRKVRCLHARGKDDKPSKMEMLAIRHLHGRPKEETFHERFRLYQQSQTGGHIFTETFRKSLLSESEVPTSKVSDPHPNIPALSSAVTLSYKPDRGRHIVTARDVYPGETLLVEDSFCTCLKEASLARRCTTCCTRSINPIPCPTCSLVVFCSEECRARGLADYHEQECEVLPALAAFSGDTPCVLAFRILMRLSFARLKELIPRLKKEAETLPPEKLGFNEDGIYSSYDFRAIYHLCSNKQHHTNKQLFGRCIEAFIVTKLLEMSRRYFVNSRGEPVCPSEEDVLLTGSTLVSLIMKLRCNIFTIKDLQVSYNITGDVVGANVGTKVLATMSLLNHSCNPSAVPSYGSDPSSLYAVRFIPAGEEVTTFYGFRYFEKDTSARRHHLLIHYYFLCKCEACESDWPEKSHFPAEVSMKCVECAEAVSCKTGECRRCRVEKPKQGDVVRRNKKIGKEILRTVEAYTHIRNSQRFMDGNSEEDREVISKVIELMDRHVVLPCKLYYEAQETLQVYLNRAGKFMYVIPDKKEENLNDLSRFYWPLLA